jgi:hypothetical protein
LATNEFTIESLAGNDFRIFLFFFSFLTLIDSTDKLESEELSLLDCELKSEDTLNYNKKSGMVAMTTDHVVNPQIWPQTNLQYEYVSKGVTFQQLDFKLFVAREF